MGPVATLGRVDGNEIRARFLGFFQERGHHVVPSSSLISPDPKLLLTTAGMLQFVPYFLGREAPPFSRATSVQKSFRLTDLDNVGHTARQSWWHNLTGTPLDRLIRSANDIDVRVFPH